MGPTEMKPQTITAISPDREVRALLAACELRTADLNAPVADLEFYGWRNANARIVATVGLEPAGHEILLRSLAVDPAHRGRGLAAGLLAFGEGRAAELGFERIHLLTTSAVAYFANRGYKYEQRDRAPTAVRATAQFTELCPTAAQYMTKAVSGIPT